MSYKRTKGRAPGCKEGKLEGGASQCWLLLSETPDTGQCRRIVVRGDRRHLKILAVEAIIFVYETVWTLAETSVTGANKGIQKGMQNLMLKKF